MVKLEKIRVRNEDIRKMVGVAPIQDKLRENRLRWFGHVQRRPIEAVVRRCDTGVAEGTSRGSGRPRLKWENSVNRDMTLLDLTKQMTLDRTE